MEIPINLILTDKIRDNNPILPFNTIRGDIKPSDIKPSSNQHHHHVRNLKH